MHPIHIGNLKQVYGNLKHGQKLMYDGLVVSRLESQGFHILEREVSPKVERYVDYNFCDKFNFTVSFNVPFNPLPKPMGVYESSDRSCHIMILKLDESPGECLCLLADDAGACSVVTFSHHHVLSEWALIDDETISDVLSKKG